MLCDTIFKLVIMRIITFVLSIIISLSFSQQGHSQIFKKKKKEVPKEEEKEPEKKKKESKIKPFEEIITEESVSDIGLWNTHKVDDVHYFELGDSPLGKGNPCSQPYIRIC